MKSKLIIGIPLLFIAISTAFNYFSSPPVSSENILGSYDVVGGPFEGCIVLHQPGAGIKVNADLDGTDTLAGEVDGPIFNLGYSIAEHNGTAALTVALPTLTGDWTGTDASGATETGTWSFTKRDVACS